ncbi:metallophosphoesterase [Hahella sp. CR1]|uniref:metallophosphoesterase n=1 Tax=Hahella sp. CR1 TaxID=2992807 RepID=UPI002441A20B|nr:metallophosphoesterase [Hahella sp. CR1]MDG9668590.1 metallophosphoesterase [Hahella sp. CR1]
MSDVNRTLARSIPETEIHDDADLLTRLEQRLGFVHARQRLGIEQDHAQRVFGGGGINFFHPENWYSMQTLMRWTFKLAGMYEWGRRNARNIQVTHNPVRHRKIPAVFKGFRLLHLTDLHVDMDEAITARLLEITGSLEYDLCVITGDYRAQTYGPEEGALEGMRRLRERLRGEAYAIFGNHDSIRMLPPLEDMGYRMLMNESALIEREGEKIQIVGVDDPHYYRVDNLQMAAQGLDMSRYTLLLSHTPEIFKQAAHAGIDLMLCGHTHGGQVCLPGGTAITLDSDCPRFVGRGNWRWRDMDGYTSTGAGSSLLPVRFNCPPEVVVHTFYPG